jgi:hypothetical protein
MRCLDVLRYLLGKITISDNTLVPEVPDKPAFAVSAISLIIRQMEDAKLQKMQHSSASQYSIYIRKECSVALPGIVVFISAKKE